MTLTNNIYNVPENVQIKQILPLQEGTTVMMESIGVDGNPTWIDMRETPFSIALALVKYEGDSIGVVEEVLPYDLTESEVLFDNSFVVNLVRCPCCGKEMRPHLDSADVCEVYYTCSCGKKLENFLSVGNEWYRKDNIVL